MSDVHRKRWTFFWHNERTEEFKVCHSEHSEESTDICFPYFNIWGMEK